MRGEKSISMNRRMLTLAGCFFLLPLLSNCSRIEREDCIRYRITLEIDTDQGLKSGSSVWEACLRDAWLSSPHGTVAWRYSGEAIAVDLPRGSLFALMQNDRDNELPFAIMRNRLIAEYDEMSNWHETWKSAWPGWKMEKMQFELPVDDYPTLVRFRDIQNPETVEMVDPENLKVKFGHATKLKRFTVKITDDPITSGITERFAWRNKYLNYHFDGTRSNTEDMTNKNISAHLSTRSFSTFSKR